jgi:hypothetical protein
VTPSSSTTRANGLQRTGPVDGVGMPPVELAATAVFDEPGDFFNSLRFAARDVHVPISVVSDTGVDDLVVASRRFTAALAPAFVGGRDHRLRFTFGDGSQREISGRYTGGWSGVLPQYDTISDEWDDNVVTFHCLDPLFYDVADTTFSGTAGSARPFFPMFADENDVGPHIASANVFSQFLVTNAGSLYAWPKWRVNGPGRDLIITNAQSGYKLDTTGKGFVLNDDEYVIIDTRPGVRSMVRNDGLNMFDTLTDDSWMFPILVGQQTIDMELGASTETSAVTLTFRQRYVSI